MAKFPDLTGDGEVTQADILKGRGVKTAKKGGLMKKKCYEEGGEVEFETKTGRNESIGDDVRARAMAAMAAKGNVGESEKSESKAKPKAEAKSKAEPKAAPSKAKSEGTFSKSDSTFSKSDSTFSKSDGAFNKSGGAFNKSESPFGKKQSTFKKMASGGSVKSSASRRGDGCAIKGKTKGRMV
jgi:hypothetical protein